MFPAKIGCDLQQQEMQVSSSQSVCNEDSLQFQQSPKSSVSSQTQSGEGEQRDLDLPTKTDHSDPDREHISHGPKLHDMPVVDYYLPGLSSKKGRTDFQRCSPERVSDHGHHSFLNTSPFSIPFYHFTYSANQILYPDPMLELQLFECEKKLFYDQKKLTNYQETHLHQQRQHQKSLHKGDDVSEHGSPSLLPNPPSLSNPSTSASSSASYDTGGRKKTDDALKIEKEELKDDKNESLHKYQQSQTSCPGPSLEQLLTEYKKALTDYQKACNDYQKSLADCQKARIDYQKSHNDYQKSLADCQKARIDYQKSRNDDQKVRTDYQKVRTDYQKVRTDYQKAHMNYQKTYVDLQNAHSDFLKRLSYEKALLNKQRRHQEGSYFGSAHGGSSVYHYAPSLFLPTDSPSSAGYDTGTHKSSDYLLKAGMEVLKDDKSEPSNKYQSQTSLPGHSSGQVLADYQKTCIDKQLLQALKDDVKAYADRISKDSSLIDKPLKRRASSIIGRRTCKRDSLSMTPVTDSPDYMLDRLSADLLREKGGIKTHSSAAGSTSGLDSTSPDNPREMELNTTASPSILQLSTSDDDDSDSDALCHREKEGDESSDRFWFGGETSKCKRTCLRSPPLSDPYTHLPNKKDTDEGGPSFSNTGFTSSVPTSSQSTAPTVAAPPCPRDRPTVLQDSTVSTEGSRTRDAFELLSVQSEREPGADRDALMEIDAAVTAVKHSVTTTLPALSQLLQSPECFRSRRDSGCLPRSHSLPSLSQITSEETQTFTRAESVPDVLLTNSFEEFTPEIRADENDESYWFQCSCPGLYQCRVTGLLFDMEAAGDVVYGIVPWNRRLLAQHHKKPAGPLFDIECLQQSVRQLHVPHCEIRSTGGCDFLSVAHVNDEGVEFISPHKITETHVIINITGFSAFGNVKDEDSPPVPVRALVLLFYRPPADPDPTSLLNVLLLPRNVALRDVLRTRKKLVGDERYIETSSNCKLLPQQEYTLSTCPEDDSVRVQPKEAEFDSDNYENYITSFQVRLKKILADIMLLLRDNDSSLSVWESEVCLSSTGVRRSCGQSAVNLPPHEKLLDVRSSFIDGISGPVLKSLLDKLLEKKVMSDPERESADVMPNTRDKARFVIDTVRKKGEAASSEMIEFLCEADPFLCEHLGFI